MTVNPLSLHFLQNHPLDSARLLEQFEPTQIAVYLEQLPVKPVAIILRHMTPAKVVSCLAEMDVNTSAKILEQFSIERASSLLRRMKPNIRSAVIRSMSILFANMIKLVMKFPDDAVGRYMSPNVFTVHQNMSVGDVLSLVRESADQVRSEIYIVDDKQCLTGIVYIRNLFTADPSTLITQVMRSTFVTIPARTRLVKIQHHPEWKSNDMLPVIDRNGMFIGVLKREVMIDVLTRNLDMAEHQDDFANTALAIAELFWGTCAELLVSDTEHQNKGAQDGRNK